MKSLLFVVALVVGMSLMSIAKAADPPPCTECGDSWPYDCLPKACRMPGHVMPTQAVTLAASETMIVAETMTFDIPPDPGPVPCTPQGCPRCKTLITCPGLPPPH